MTDIPNNIYPKTNRELDNQRLLNLGLFLILSLSIIFLISIYASRGIRIENREPAFVTPNPLQNIEIEAKAAIVYDLKRKKVLFEKNADKALPLASLTKVMTAVTALELVPDSSVVTIHSSFLKEEGDSGLHVNEDWKLRDLLDLSLVVSSNDAAAAISATIGASFLSDPDLDLGREEFVKIMNKTASSIGLNSAIFYNDTGLDIGTDKNGGYASARDYVTLLSYALKEHPQIFEATRYEEIIIKSLDNLRYNATNTNVVLNKIPNIIGSKTGFTDIAGGNVSTIFDIGLGQPIVIVVLGSSYDGRFSDLTKLSEKALEAVEAGY